MITAIHIHNAELAEPTALGEVLARLAQHENVDKADIFIEPRNHIGWLEYLLCIKYVSTGKITIGCVSRRFNARMEFHS